MRHISTMANIVLFLSSVLWGIVHVALFIYFQGPWYFIVVYGLGVATSIANHGLSNNVAKWGDRIMMAVSAPFDIVFTALTDTWTYRLVGFAIILTGIVCYFGAKRAVQQTPDFKDERVGIAQRRGKGKPGNEFHLISHAVITGLHGMLFYAYNQ